MKNQYRVEKIVEYLTVHNLATVEDLVKVVNVSPATIRRDLVKLDEQGVITRTHGGVSLNRFVASQPTTNEKMMLNPREKNLIAEAAADLVSPGDSVVLDAGTTSMALAKHFIDIPLRVITVDLHIALFLSQYKQIEVIVAGGKVDDSSQSTVGEHCRSLLRSINPDIAFITCNSWSIERGITTPTEEKTILKRDLIANADKKVMIADSSKYGKYSLFKVCDLHDIDMIISDRHLSDEVQSQMALNGLPHILV
ncbi:DeoR/GlpR family DNA-binding transcription regulator [Vibrio rhizosphaerae]|uniref:DeoR/GlpR family DNA-binding transcription regulator n=1 Tax=Vibrio rhizosphaerae TaxID=398736 RepID=A0ABU4IY50_9VIBR|nr:DeoR/GlpR family DNA-binding transcription regulator [Vibrio rhizosphaerae]MDW6094329.1 DeoR/GlpR family DNA-binding transcription regulator [Vibrio rhizosphaerae]